MVARRRCRGDDGRRARPAGDKTATGTHTGHYICIIGYASDYSSNSEGSASPLSLAERLECDTGGVFEFLWILEKLLTGNEHEIGALKLVQHLDAARIAV